MFMSRLLRTRMLYIPKLFSLPCAESNFTSSKSNHRVSCFFHRLNQIRFHGTERSADLINGVDFAGNGKTARALREQAQSALTEYFHLTRSFSVVDAENMSVNAPQFFDRLMKRVKIEDGEISHSIARFLMYNPVNEFEPFFESIGLKPCEYLQYLPRDLMFLADDELLLENYYVLCDYGVNRSRIGRIFKEANEVFRYDNGALQRKLRSFEDLGLKQCVVAKVVASSPHLLIGNVGDFVEFMEKLNELGIEYDWLRVHIREEDSYNWKCMLHLICLFCRSGWSETRVGELFKQHPNILLESSGRITLTLIGFLLKLGSTMSQVRTLFLHFPQIPLLKFAHNLHNSYKFLIEMDMSAQDIHHIVCSYPKLIGCIKLKKASSIVKLTRCGKEMLCEMITDDPSVLEGWVRGKRVVPLEYVIKDLKTQFLVDKVVRKKALKTEFLLTLGFEENSEDMEKTLKILRGRGMELQHRFDCLVSNGLSPEEAIKMAKDSPQIFNQSRDVIERKIRYFFCDLGYRVCDLLSYPKTLTYTSLRLKLRLSMYKWLMDEGVVRRNLSLSSILSCSEEYFIRNFVAPHAGGPAFWKRLKKKHIQHCQ